MVARRCPKRLRGCCSNSWPCRGCCATARSFTSARARRWRSWRCSRSTARGAGAAGRAALARGRCRGGTAQPAARAVPPARARRAAARSGRRCARARRRRRRRRAAPARRRAAAGATGRRCDGLDGVGSVELDAWLQRWRDAARRSARRRLLDREAAACESRGELAAALALQAARAGLPIRCKKRPRFMSCACKAALGDRTGALQAYQRLAEALRDELDIAPSAPLQALARRCATAAATARRRGRDAAAAGRRPAPRRPRRRAPSPPAPRAGRCRASFRSCRAAAPQQQIEAAWATRPARLPARAGRDRQDPAGERAGGGARRRGCASPASRRTPSCRTASVVRLLRALRDSAPDVALPDWVRRELAQLMPELGEPPQALATDEARQRLLAAVAEAWRLLMRDNFSAIVLDDWHWGDPASVDVWSRLDDGRGRRGTGGLDHRLPQRAAAAGGARRGSAPTSTAGAASRSRSRAWTSRGARADARALRLRRRAAVLAAPARAPPKAIRSSCSRRCATCSSSGCSPPTRAAGARRSTSTPRTTPSCRCRRACAPRCRRACGRLARRRSALLEVGEPRRRRARRRACSPASASSTRKTRSPALEHARAAQLVAGDETGWRFAHDLVRQSLVHGLSAGRRRLLHERLAQQLGARKVPRRRCRGAVGGGAAPGRGVRWRVAAAEAALRVHALNEALAAYAQALADGACGRGDGGDSPGLRRGASAARRSPPPPMPHSPRRAARRATRRPARGRAAGAAGAGRAPVHHRSHRRRPGRARRARRTSSPRAAPEVRAKALAMRGAGLMRQGKYNAAEALVTEAEALFEGRPRVAPRAGGAAADLARCSQLARRHRSLGRYARRAVGGARVARRRAGLATALSLAGPLSQVHGRGREGACRRRARACAGGAPPATSPVHRNVNFNLVADAHGHRCIPTGAAPARRRRGAGAAFREPSRRS